MEKDQYVSWSDKTNITFAFDNYQTIEEINFYAVQVISEGRKLQLFLPKNITIYGSYDGILYYKIMDTFYELITT